MDRGAWQATVHGVARVRHHLATKPPPLDDIVMLIWLQFAWKGRSQHVSQVAAGRLDSVEL